VYPFSPSLLSLLMAASLASLPSFEHEFFHGARAQKVGTIPPDTHENDVLWEMGTFKQTAIVMLPLFIL
jgi:hypothetical protein